MEPHTLVKLIVLLIRGLRNTLVISSMGGPNLQLWPNMHRRPSIIYALRRLGLSLRFLISTIVSLAKPLKLRSLLVILIGTMARKLVDVGFLPSLISFLCRCLSPLVSFFFYEQYFIINYIIISTIIIYTIV